MLDDLPGLVGDVDQPLAAGPLRHPREQRAHPRGGARHQDADRGRVPDRVQVEHEQPARRGRGPGSSGRRTSPAAVPRTDPGSRAPRAARRARAARRWCAGAPPSPPTGSNRTAAICGSVGSRDAADPHRVQRLAQRGRLDLAQRSADRGHRRPRAAARAARAPPGGRRAGSAERRRPARATSACTPTAAHSGPYSRLTSSTNARRPNSSIRHSSVLTSALLPWPSLPSTIAFGSSSAPVAVQDPRVVTERAAARVPADEHAAAAEAAGGRRTGRSPARGGSCSDGRAARRAHRSPRHSGSVNVNASACWPYMRCSSRRARAACSWISGAGAAQVVAVAPGDRHEPGQPDLAVAGGELGLAAHRCVLRLALAGGLGLAEAVAQLAVGAVTGDGGLDLARRALGRDRLERDRHRPDHARASEQRVHEHRRDLDARPSADPVRSRARRRRCGSAPSARARRAATRSPRRGRPGRARQPRAPPARRGRTDRRPSAAPARAGPRAERAEHGHLGRLEPLGDPLGLLDQRCRRRLVPRSRPARASTWTAIRTSCSWAALRGRADQLEIGLDHRRAAQRDAPDPARRGASARARRLGPGAVRSIHWILPDRAVPRRPTGPAPSAPAAAPAPRGRAARTRARGRR